MNNSRVWALCACVVFGVGIASTAIASKEEWMNWDDWVGVYTAPLTNAQQKAMLSHIPATQQPFVREALWDVWGKQSGMGKQFKKEYERRMAQAQSALGFNAKEQIVIAVKMEMMFGAPARIVAINTAATSYPARERRMDSCRSVGRLEAWEWETPNRDGPITVIFVGGKKTMWRGVSDADLTVEQMRISIGATASLCADGEVGMMIHQARRWARRVEQMVEERVIFADEETYNQQFAFAIAREPVLPKGSAGIYDIMALESGRDGVLTQVTLMVKKNVWEWKEEHIGAYRMVTPIVEFVFVQGDVTRRQRVAFKCDAGLDRFFLTTRMVLPAGTHEAFVYIREGNRKVGMMSDRVSVEEPAVAISDTTAASIVPTKHNSRTAPMTLRADVADPRYATGVVRFTTDIADTIRENITRVEFTKQGSDSPFYAKNRFPFEGFIDIGDIPIPVTIEAIAYGENGREWARASVVLNEYRAATSVRLKSFHRNDRSGDRVRIEGYVAHPPDAACDFVEVFRDNVFVERLSGDVIVDHVLSFTIPMRRQETVASVVRVCVVFQDNSFAEDIVVVSDGFSGIQEVSLVELPVFVTRYGGLP